MGNGEIMWGARCTIKSMIGLVLGRRAHWICDWNTSRFSPMGRVALCAFLLIFHVHLLFFVLLIAVLGECLYTFSYIYAIRQTDILLHPSKLHFLMNQSHLFSFTSIYWTAYLKVNQNLIVVKPKIIIIKISHPFLFILTFPFPCFYGKVD